MYVQPEHPQERGKRRRHGAAGSKVRRGARRMVLQSVSACISAPPECAAEQAAHACACAKQKPRAGRRVRRMPGSCAQERLRLPGQLTQHFNAKPGRHVPLHVRQRAAHRLRRVRVLLADGVDHLVARPQRKGAQLLDVAGVGRRKQHRLPRLLVWQRAQQRLQRRPAHAPGVSACQRAAGNGAGTREQAAHRKPMSSRRSASSSTSTLSSLMADASAPLVR